MNHTEQKRRLSRAFKSPLVWLQRPSSLDAHNLPHPRESYQFGQNLDSFGRNNESEIFWNSYLDTFGLVCSPSKEANDSVVKRIIASHIHITDGPVLILHASKGLPVPKGCTLATSAQTETNSNHNVIISPRKLGRMYDLYSGLNTIPVSLAVEEKDIQTRHLLALFASMSSVNGGSGTLNAINHVVGQLEELFDLQRFNRLVEEEKWDSDGESFMALRQTILAELLSSQDDIQLSSIFDSQQEIVVDLSDPILSKTRLDEVLMDIVLWSFLKHHEGKKSLVVIDNSQDFLSAESVLTRTLASLARQGLDRNTKVVLSTTDPATSPPSITSTLDYCFCGYSWSPLWRHTLSDSLDIPFDLKALHEGEVALVCPFNSVLGREEGKEPEGASTYIVMHVDELQSSMPQILETSMNGSQPLNLPTTHPSETRDDSTTESPFIDSKQSSSMDSAVGTITITDEQSLVSAVRSLSGGQADIWVKYSDVRKKFNMGKDSLNSTSSFISIVKSACKEGLIDHARIDGGDFISLTIRGAGSKDPTSNPSPANDLPVQAAGLTLDPIQSPMPPIFETSKNGSPLSPPPTTRPSETRENITVERAVSPLTDSKESPSMNSAIGTITTTDERSLVSAVRALSGGQVGVRVKYSDVRKKFNIGRDSLNPTSSFISIVKSACKEGLIDHARIDGGDFISLTIRGAGSKVIYTN
ncbi:hypothetical protein FRC15_004709 [Serendipita sp. 397]|nr:hypothetical protein FRC15_004709 [Serendipita sp. 397]